MLTLDGQLITNNSIVYLADICNDNSSVLLCSDPDQVDWYFPDGSVVPRGSGQTFFTESDVGMEAYLVCNSSAQSPPTGLFRCEGLGSVYVGVYDENSGKSFINFNCVLLVHCAWHM